MVSIFILVFAVIALVRFGISQWRAIWISAANQPLSDSLQLAAGIDGATIGSRDFGPLLDLCSRLSPELKKINPWLKEESVYYRSVSKLKHVLRATFPSIPPCPLGSTLICSLYAQ